MTKIRKITHPIDESIKEILLQLNKIDLKEIHGIIVLGLNKDRSHWMRVSSLTQMEKMFLARALTVYLDTWFNFREK